MKSVDITKLRQLDNAKLHIEADKLRKDMAKEYLNINTGKAKNTNIVAAKKRELAVILTVLREKRT